MKKQLLSIVFMMFIFIMTGCGTAEQDSVSLDKQESQTTEAADSEKQGDSSTDPEAVQDMEEAGDKEGSESSVAEDTKEETDTQASSLPEMQVHYIDVGQADATLFMFDTYTLLLDAGDWNNNDVIEYLHSQNVSQIDVAIGTHPDADHIGQLDKVINQFEVDEVWMSGNTSTSGTYRRVLEAIDADQTGYDEPRMGDVFDIGDLQVQVLYPASISGEVNKESLAFKMSYGEIDFIFTGDAESAQEQEMIGSGTDLDAEVLQLGHHGSKTSTSKAFLEEVSPETAIYSAGKDNQYGHPHQEVVDRIEEFGADLFGTDAHGTIMVTTDGKSYQVTTHENGNIEPGQPESDQEESNQDQTDSNESPQNSNGSCIEVNSADMETMQEIIHIGPDRAQEIIDLRPFQSIDDLTNVSGIGPARLDDIKEQGIACIGGGKA